MMGREQDNDLGYHDQDSEPSLNAPGDAGPTGIVDREPDADQADDAAGDEDGAGEDPASD